MKILFRSDDFYLNGRPSENKIISIFNNNNIKITLGVIPFDMKGLPFTEGLPLDLDISNCQLCVHGYKHERREGVGLKGEFSGLPLAEQFDMLYKGKKQLELIINKEVPAFIPPFNVADMTTLAALESIGFRQILVGQTYIGVRNDHQVQQILTGVEHFHFLKTPVFRFISLYPFRYLFRNVLLVVLFHPYNFKEIKNDYFVGERAHFSINFDNLNSILNEVNKRKINTVWGGDIEQYHVKKSKSVFLRILSAFIKKKYGYRVVFQTITKY